MPSARRRSGAAEDLLGRDVRHVRDAVRVGRASAGPPRVRRQPDREIGVRAVVAHLGQLQRVQRAPAGGQLRGPLLPGGDRVGLVEAHRRGDRLPQPLDVWFAEYLLRPAPVRRRDHGPALLLPEHRLLAGHRLCHRERGGLRRVDVVEQVRIGVAGQPDPDGSLGGVFLDPLDRPGPGLRQALEARVAEPRVPDRAVRPVDLDPFGADGIGALHHRPRDLQVGGVGAKQHAGARLDVDPDPDDQVGEPFKVIAARHGSHSRS